MLKLVRCDDRLIHGQCMTYIINEYAIRNIIVVDEFTATNPIIKKIFTSAIPKSISASVHTLADSKEAILAAMSDNSSSLLLMKKPQTFLSLRSMIENLPDSLNIGPQTIRNGCKICTPYAALNQEEADACTTLEKQGVRVYFNSIGSGSKTVEWASVAKLFNT
jgi:mannose/fructose/N-acetylgalactosamine-specific phosphotransferase system component IIB